MKRRKFLQGLLAVTGAAAIPSCAPVSEGVAVPVRHKPGGTSPAALARCAFFDYDDNLVMEGMFVPTPRFIIPVARRLLTVNAPTHTFLDAEFERAKCYYVPGPVIYEQVSGPRMPRRGYVV